MSNIEETIKLKIPESFTFGDFTGDDFDKILGFFDWSLKDKTIEFDSSKSVVKKDSLLVLYYLYCEHLFFNNCSIRGRVKSDVVYNGVPIPRNSNAEFFTKQISDNPKLVETTVFPIVIVKSEDCDRAIEFAIKYTKNFSMDFEKSLRYVLNEILYNTIEHGRNENNILSLLQFFLDEESKEISFIVADLGAGIRKHLRQTYQNLSTDSEAILHSIKPQISGTFGRPSTGYETKNNAGVGLFFSSSIAQRLNADMFIVSGNGFVHISPTEIIAKELDNQWKGTFVYVKMKLDLIKDLNFQKMLAEITKSIPKAVEVTQENNLQISVMNYFGKYAEDKDLAKKIRDKYLLPALAENKSLTIDFEDIVSAPHSLLNAMLATPIERLGLSAYKKIKIINAAPEIRETLDFIFDDNTSNA
jgi:STAS-like domain of unknown function (DUF4325)